jgi:hypothetical protein
MGYHGSVQSNQRLTPNIKIPKNFVTTQERKINLMSLTLFQLAMLFMATALVTMLSITVRSLIGSTAIFLMAGSEFRL